MPFAFNMLRDRPHYRREGFSAGLRQAGFEVLEKPPQSIGPGDLVLSWNRYNQNHDICCAAENAGAIVLVAENGYVAKGGFAPHEQAPRSVYALARGAHNDHRGVPDGDGSRWNALGVDLKPWRTAGSHVLILPNRSFGTPGRIMPADWANDVRRKLLALTKREVMLRPHPGSGPPAKPLAADLAGAWCTVIWASSAGVHSLIAGVPTICLAPFWIAKSAAGSDLLEIEKPPMPDRLNALRRMAWAQFSTEEIASGFAFRAVLGMETQQETQT